ncbi:hypothetical protein PG999_011946 [Apiospora kogelbergensis]|uniref:Uncharacterized protein n=1 Tax=Apiospora kogelbergensis TaxID=1337665 RepID=A0AAW0QGA4_9PEZI
MGNVYSPSRAGTDSLQLVDLWLSSARVQFNHTLCIIEPTRQIKNHRRHQYNSQNEHRHPFALRRCCAPSAQLDTETPKPRGPDPEGNDAVPRPAQPLLLLLPAEPEHKSFIKVFGRPIFKVALMAIFTYQLAYYGWLRLEQNETREVLNDTIADLETRIAELERAKGNKKKI